MLTKKKHKLRVNPLWFFLWFLTIGALYGCSVNGKYYKVRSSRYLMLSSIELRKDSTAICSYWPADFKIRLEDKLISNGDTIQTHDMVFIHKGNKLIQQNGTIWKKKMIVFNDKWR
jgi:hypothetical protein